MLHYLGSRVISEADASGVIKREYIWLGDRIVATIDDVDTASPKLYYVVNDDLDRPIRMRNANRVEVWKAAYRLFGEAIVTGSGNLDARLPGQWFQLETGLSRNRHRPYDPAIGRYIQPDPLGLTDGPSLYGYAPPKPDDGYRSGGPPGCAVATALRAIRCGLRRGRRSCDLSCHASMQGHGISCLNWPPFEPDTQA